jgi:chemotaxis regulatin CheY-phosphate phosphatase CheZ
VLLALPGNMAFSSCLWTRIPYFAGAPDRGKSVTVPDRPNRLHNVVTKTEQARYPVANSVGAAALLRHGCHRSFRLRFPGYLEAAVSDRPNETLCTIHSGRLEPNREGKRQLHAMEQSAQLLSDEACRWRL